MISHAQNREDVVLWRALHTVGSGHYAEISANDGTDRSATTVFADHGWSGLVLVTDAAVAAARRGARPNEVVEVVQAVGDETSLAVTAALQRAGFAAGDLHLLVVEANDRPRSLRPADVPVSGWRPWVVIVTAGPNEPESADDWDAELVAAGYETCLFDGVSRFYVSPDRGELRSVLWYPACSRDEFTDQREAELAEEVSRLEAAVQQARDESLSELLRWRHAAVTTWAKSAAARASAAPREYQQLQVALAAAQRDAAQVRQTLSWRVTKPLRMVKSAGRRR
jgi:hypothetical protein